MERWVWPRVAAPVVARIAASRLPPVHAIGQALATRNGALSKMMTDQLLYSPPNLLIALVRRATLRTCRRLC